MIAQPASDDSQEAVFKCWLKQHSGLVFKVARTFAPSEADRDDLVQEILLQLWRSIPRFEGKARESTWISGRPQHGFGVASRRA
jgi:RNA polymerase sigma-70 factor (ECF subfamily)